MNWKAIRWLVTALACAVMLVIPAALYPCGPVFSSPIFVMPGPVDDAKYAAGEMGIPLRSYGRAYVFIAYRYFDGQPLSKEEQASVYSYQKGAGFQTFGAGYDSSENSEITKPWEEARQKFGAEPLAQPIDPFKEHKNYNFYLNCPPPAFVTAAATLTDRSKKFSAEELKNWVAAQDAAFSNCSGKAVNAIPADAAGSASALLKQDRAYQIAAANFYAGYFDNAIAGFRAIAADKQSPWHVWGRFLVGRSMIRKATLNVEREDEAFDPKVLEQAEEELREVVADPELAPVHEAAQQMLGFTNFRLHPAELQVRLANDLAKRTTPETMEREIGDYVKLTGNNGIEPKDDMSVWIRSFERFGTEAPDSEVKQQPPGAEVIKSWQEKKTVPWLALAISAARADDKGLKELVGEAGKVKSDSPAYPTVQYHLTRLEMERGDLAEARKQTEAFLAAKGEQVPLSTKNMFLRLRLVAASDFADFMKYAERRPVAVGAEGFDEMNEVCQQDKSTGACKRDFLDPMAAKQLDWMPLSYWMTAVNTLKAGAELRQEMVLATWTRAWLTDDWAVADHAARVTEQEVKGASKFLDTFLGSGDLATKKFAGAFAILHWPGVQPTMNVGSLRDDRLDEINNFRQNWWCGLKEQMVFQQATENKTPTALKPDFPAFLSASDRNMAQTTQAKILSSAVAPNYLVPIVLSWAKAHPDDPRVPEALALSVKATRFGCTDDRTTGFSKAAFTLLHGKYPQSEWAKKTKYYY